MNDRKSDADAFMDFMKIVTGKSFPKEPEPDPVDLRISELEQQVRALRRSTRRGLARRKSGPPAQGKPTG